MKKGIKVCYAHANPTQDSKHHVPHTATNKLEPRNVKLKENYILKDNKKIKKNAFLGGAAGLA